MEKQFYRAVNPCFEGCGYVIDTDVADLPPRMKCSVDLFPVFNILTPFWNKSGISLESACNSMLYLSDYLDIIQEIEQSGGTMIPTSLFNKNESIKEIPLSILKEMIFPYVDLYNSKGISLEIYDLPYFWEYIWEIVRKSFYPQKLGRFVSLFMFDDLQQTKRFLNEYHQDDGTIICSVKLIETRRLEEYDASWLDNVPTDCTFNTCIEYVRNYWDGKYAKNPNPEYLFSGKYQLSRI